MDADDTGNKCWNTSVKNSMTQEVSLAGRVPAEAKKDNKLNIAVLAGINPRLARCAKVSVLAVKGSATSERVIADLSSQPDGWQYVFKTDTVDADASKLQFKVSAEADNANTNGTGLVFAPVRARYLRYAAPLALWRHSRHYTSP